jgi:hypothetical protein
LWNNERKRHQFLKNIFQSELSDHLLQAEVMNDVRDKNLSSPGGSEDEYRLVGFDEYF